MNEHPSTPGGPTPESAPPRRTDILTADAPGLEAAARALAAGGLVAFPTETVYGLGADGRDPNAVAALYAAKGRPHFNPLIAHVDAVAAARWEGVLDGTAERLAEAFWPGPLTLVLPAAPGGTVCDLARSGLASVALRVPSHPLAKALLEAAGFPVVAPSANRSGRVSPTAAAHVLADLDGRIDAVLDGGGCAVGLESTIVACLEGGASLLRPGGVPREAIEQVLGRRLDAAADDPAKPLAPGALQSHYAPRARVRLDVTEIAPDEAVLHFGGETPKGLERARMVLDLSRVGDPVEAAANLFAHLRRLDGSGAPAIAVAPIPMRGLGEAINDRLLRAAAPR